MSKEIQATAQILKKVRQVEIRTKKMVADALAGSYHSSFRGQGMDFEEVREYMPGDDVRAIDWNVTARMNNAFIKLFREERELTIFLVVDLSASGKFGSSEQSKRELAAEIASLLAFSATKNNDNVGLLLYTDQVEKVIRPGKGRQHVLRVIREILFFEPVGNGTDHEIAIRSLNSFLKKKAAVFLLSDFLPAEKLVSPKSDQITDFARLLRVTGARHDVMAFHLVDERERELEDSGFSIIEDYETGEVIEVNTGDVKIREAYKRLSDEREKSIVKTIRQCGVDCLTLSTGETYLIELKKFFASRGRS